MLLNLLSSPLLADQVIEVERVDMTVTLPAGFGHASGNQPFDGWDYRSIEEDAQILAWGSHRSILDEFDRLIQNTETMGFQVDERQIDDESFTVTYVDAMGWHNIRYGRAGVDCKGRRAIGIVAFRYDPRRSDVYQPEFATLRDSVTIGACG